MFREKKVNARGWLLTLLFIVLFSATAMAAVPGQVRGLKVKKSYEEKIQLSWYTAANAEKYIVYGAEKGQTPVRIAVVKKKSVWLSRLSNGESLVCGSKYTFCVAGWNTDGTGEKSSELTVSLKANKPGKVTSLNAYPGTKQVTLKWSAASEATGYRVYSKKSSASKWTKKGEVKGTSITITSLKNNTKYDFAVRAIRTVGTSTTTGTMKVVRNIVPSTDGFGYIHALLYSARTTKSTTLQGLNEQGDRTVSAGTTLTISRTASGGYYTALYAGQYWLVSSSAVTKTAMVTKNGAYTGKQAVQYVNDQKWTSKKDYLIWVSVYAQRTFVFKKSGTKWALLRNCPCATGKFTTQSYYGKTFIKYKQTLWYFNGAVGGYWASAIAGGAFHSGPGLGAPASHGCVRLSMANAKWLYDSIPVGTSVYIF